jgi:hypothetical protein
LWSHRHLMLRTPLCTPSAVSCGPTDIWCYGPLCVPQVLSVAVPQTSNATDPFVYPKCCHLRSHRHLMLRTPLCTPSAVTCGPTDIWCYGPLCVTQVLSLAVPQTSDATDPFVYPKSHRHLMLRTPLCTPSPTDIVLPTVNVSVQLSVCW